MADNYDVAVVGGGPGGYVAAIRGAQLGAKVCVVEEDRVGGTCLVRGCIPSKTLISSAELYGKMKNATEFGIDIKGDVLPNWKNMVARKNKVVDVNVGGIQALFKSYGVTLLPGRGSFADKSTLNVAGPKGEATQIKADKVIIATGSKPANIPAFPYDGKKIISSDEALDLKELPTSILIVGGGYIGCEFASIFSELGVQVTVIEMLPRTLPLMDSSLSTVLERELKKNKVKILLGKKIESIMENDKGQMEASLEGGEKVAADLALVAVGRAPNSDGLEPTKAGVVLGKGKEIAVNEKMETKISGIYAIGDVVGIDKIMLAHVASAEGIVAMENALGKEAEMDYRVVPACVFTSPEIGSVGSTEEEAKSKGHNVKTGVFPFRSLGKAHAIGETSGEVKIVSDSETDEVLGLHIIGPHATDLIAEAALAMKGELTVEEIASTIHAHPTLAEAMMETAHDVHKMAIHLPKGK